MQHMIACVDFCQLDELGQRHRLHEMAPGADIDVLIDIGDAAAFLGYEELAWQRRHRLDDASIGDAVGAHLRCDHSGAGDSKVCHKTLITK